MARKLEDMKTDEIVKEVFEVRLDIYFKLICWFKINNPDLGSALEPHFDEFIKVSRMLFDEGKAADVMDVAKIIPHNQWISLLIAYGSRCEESTFDVYVDSYRQLVQERLDREDEKN